MLVLERSIPDKSFNMEAPIAKKIAKKLVKHDHERIDHYYWLNDREDKAVLDYLTRENEYLESKMGHTMGLQKTLFEEMKARIKEDEESVPYKYNGYWYITRFEKGKGYPIYTRKKESLDAPEEILFDCNEMAKNHAYFKLSGLNISEDNKYAAFGIDTVGRRQYSIQIKNLETEQLYPEKIENTTGGSAWANDNKTLFYVKKDVQTLRANKVCKHHLNSDPASDQEVFEESDDTFYCYVYKTKSKKFIVIGSSSTLSDEYHILNADQPNDNFKLFTARETNLEHDIYHQDNSFYVLTNADQAINFKLMKTTDDLTARQYWKTIIEHNEDVLLEDIDIFKDFLVVSERFDGLNRIHIKPWDNNKEAYYLPFDSDTFTAQTTVNLDFDTEILRYGYTSLTRPPSIFDFNMTTREKQLKKVSEIPDGKFNSEDYNSKRIWIKARDGKKVAISMVYNKEMIQNGNNPLLLYAYGSYGTTISPSFRRNVFSLIDRGFVFAIAHVRGGEYLGRSWYDDGKLFNKMNTFNDFIDCSRHLIKEKYTAPEHHYAMGGSAGGLLMGVIVNEAPELYNGVIAAVPFVDVVTTMLNDNIPLTTFEYDEWGNPNDVDSYRYILSYSPYDQVVRQEYPNLLVTTGLHDSQVQYWEPAKWVAKLRENKTDDNVLLLKTNMDAGHGGASGRFESLKEDALEYAFLLDLEGISK